LNNTLNTGDNLLATDAAAGASSLNYTAVLATADLLANPGYATGVTLNGISTLNTTNLEASVRSAAQHCVRTVADLIEAGLNEDAGRFALALLWALCRAASECRRVGLQPCEASMIVLTSDRQQIGIRSRGERAPMAWDEGRDAVRAQIASTASNWQRDGIDAKRDCWWDRHGRAHEVSHQNGRDHWQPRGRSAMTLITPPHSGQVANAMEAVGQGVE
jgi:hypothetical protein